MDCKNCKHPLENDARFCDNCGGKIIKNRISFKLLFTELFSSIFGVDSKYFLTLKKMFTDPSSVLNEYLTGVRKRYVNPFAYLAVSAALSLVVFNFFSDDFIKINEAFNETQNPELIALAKTDSTAYIGLEGKALEKFKIQQKIAKNQIAAQESWTKFMLGYFNLLAFLFLPIYAFMSKFTYFKPHNFGEHIIINAYLQGSVMYITLIMFSISLLTNPLVYHVSIIFLISYYIFAFSKLYKHSFGKALLKLLRFIGVFILFIIIVLLIGMVIGLLIFAAKKLGIF